MVSRVKTPKEIMEEYARLQEIAEERRLEQRTNPRVILDYITVVFNSHVIVFFGLSLEIFSIRYKLP